MMNMIYDSCATCISLSYLHSVTVQYSDHCTQSIITTQSLHFTQSLHVIITLHSIIVQYSVVRHHRTVLKFITSLYV
jgi:hypothetical protein